MRIAIVNDTPLAIEALRRVVVAMPAHSIAWVAEDGAEALKKCALDTPDLILMDLVMPKMDGVEATRRIMIRNPCAILVVTATIEGNAAKVVEAIGAGALDAIRTPVLAVVDTRDEPNSLQQKIEAIGKLISGSEKTKRVGDFLSASQASTATAQNLVVIGASAGGPSALATILKALPRNFPAAIVVVQHIDGQFAASMASWLGEQCSLPVRLACDQDKPKSGEVLVAGTNHHLVFLNSRTVGYTSEPRDSYYHPSIDIFFESVARHWKGNTVGVLLTGMGRDGAKALKTLRDGGALTISQDAESCVVYGMPKAAAELDAAMEILPLQSIAPRLMRSLKCDIHTSC